MALSYKARRRLSLLVLLVGLPAYVVVAVSLVNWMDRPSILVELGIYVGLGMLWILPLRPVFMGVGQPDPDAAPPQDDRRD
ncbi:DUF2842 domain-containing protein [Pseudotabrizicola formosa]|uniref:DUF2842 domain-containing protein n=1 Tax=Pseudotabrizicola formosa TaxID=2030009 RepID=UPI000CD1B5D2|nr:DUF2842 domain-containing protein [Pseudotabrizicola formosa]